MKAKKLDGYQSPHWTKFTTSEPVIYVDRSDTTVTVTIDLPTFDCPIVLEVSRKDWEADRVKDWRK